MRAPLDAYLLPPSWSVTPVIRLLVTRINTFRINHHPDGELSRALERLFQHLGITTRALKEEGIAGWAM